MSNGISYEIVEEIGVLSRKPSGWKKELNLVSWNGNPAKYDIHEWLGDHEKMTKGITLSQDEAAVLLELLRMRSL